MKVLFFFPALTLMLMLRVTAEKQGTQCDVPVRSNICKTFHDCSSDSDCVIAKGDSASSCFPKCDGFAGTQCVTGRCCYLQDDGTYTTSMPPFTNDAQGACL